MHCVWLKSCIGFAISLFVVLVLLGLGLVVWLVSVSLRRFFPPRPVIRGPAGDSIAFGDKLDLLRNFLSISYAFNDVILLYFFNVTSSLARE